MSILENITSAVQQIQQADAIFITAGAGIGVDSGLPDFRGNEGFWNAYPPIAKLGISFVEMANPYWFQNNPKLAWAFYGHRLNLYRRTTPHSGFSKLLDFAQKKPGGYFVFTSNVDGQFQKAGFNEDYIEECHGSINHFQCSVPCSDQIWDAGNISVKVDEEKFAAIAPLPKCIKCDAVARPNILLFGDWSWISDRSGAQSNSLHQWLNSILINKQKLVIIEIGAGEAVPTVRMKSESIAAHYNATLIRINPRDFNVPAGHISIKANAAEGINAIFENL